MTNRAQDIPYTVRRSTRARRVRVAVHSQDSVEVVLPAGASERAAAAAVLELAPWIERRLAEARSARQRLGRRSGVVPYLDEDLLVVVEADRTRVHRRGSELLVPGDETNAALERWFRRAARREIAPRLELATRATGTRYRDLTIRGQRTRWASCSANGRMSFNWRLLLAPARILDYVVWHEVCHLEVLDHSARFWSLLERRRPSYRDDRDWLRRNGSTLVLDGSI